jgi:hypothetical protein
MLTPSQRARILQHLEHGWKLPDSLVHDLWAAYEYLEGRQPVRDRMAEDADSAARREIKGRDTASIRG